MRLDAYLVEKGLFVSRARAQAAVKAGLVAIDGALVARPSARVPAGAVVDVKADVHDYVSRGGVKLAFALDRFGIDPMSRVCLDLGASTGGFTEVLLRRGAAKVYAVDVGTAQLHPSVAADSRVISLEQTHANTLSRALIPEPIDLLVCDVSFISLRKALGSVLALCAPGAELVALVKPQFELGPDRVGKGGVVKADPKTIGDMLAAVGVWLAERGWKSQGAIDSPIAGGDGNREYLIAATR